MDYEKAYKKAVEQARKELKTCGSMDCAAARQIFRLFPQLRESEDERIRKELISQVEKSRHHPADKARWLAYLEKQKDASKAIEAVDRIDKYIDEHLANAHDMKDSNPDKKYYRGWDDALGKMAGILQDVYSNEKQKEQKQEQPEKDCQDFDSLFDEFCDAHPDGMTLEECGRFFFSKGKLTATNDFSLALAERYCKGLRDGQEEYWNPNEEDVTLFNKAITTNKSLTPDERAKLDIIRMKFKHRPVIKQKEQKHPNGCFTCDEYKKGYEAGRSNGFTAGYNKAMKEQKPVEKKITLTSFEEALNTFLFNFANSPIEDCEPKEYVKKYSAEILKVAYKELNAKLQQDIFEAQQEGRREGYEVAKAEQKLVECELEDAFKNYTDAGITVSCGDMIASPAGKPLFKKGDWVVYDGVLGHGILQVKDVKAGRYTFVDNESTLLAADSDKCLRPLTPKDLIKPAEWSEDYREEDIQTRFAFYTYKDDSSVLYLSNVFVEEASRNHGFGTRILKAAEKVAETVGAITISLKVKQDSPANAWYRKHGYGYVAFEDGYDWLEKNLEYLKPQKPEWSEEDEEIFNHIIYCAESRGWIPFNEIGWLKSRFKSLRPQPHWKPSEEQMKHLERCFSHGHTSQLPNQHVLESLYNELKKLM